jgi:hypothetical protein
MPDHRLLRGPAIGALLGTVLLASPLLAGQPQRESRETHVRVAVLNRDREPAAGLTAKDFIVREDGIAREVIRAAPAPIASHVALLVDTSEASRPLVPMLRDALTAFAGRLRTVTPPPEIMLMTFGERPERVVSFQSSAAELNRAIGRLFVNASSGAYLLDAILEAAGQFRQFQAPHPAVVAFTVESGPEYSDVLHQRVADALQAARASLWTIVLQSGTPPASADARERSLVVGDVTRASGGMNYPVLDRLGLQRAFEAVAGLLASGYDVTYARPDSLIPARRRTVEMRDGALRALASEEVRP